MPKTLKSVVQDITKAAEKSKFEKLIELLPIILGLLGKFKKNPFPTAAQRSQKGFKADKTLPDKEDIQNAVIALNAMCDRVDQSTPPAGAKAGLLGGRVNWKVIIPVGVDLVKKLLENMNAEMK
jgi:hypothetical protein